MTVSVEQARLTAAFLLEGPLPRRWSHVRAVGTKAEAIAGAVAEADRVVLAAAAWLHDVGYSPDLVDTGFHSLDGARWLRANGFDERVTALVAHHSCAWLEAEERGLGEVLAAEFPREVSSVADGLCYCDMTTGPDGQSLDVPARLAEIRSRYGPDALVTRFITRAEPDILAAAERTQTRLTAAGIAQPI
ncbi:metal-dependent phosphohydrolase, HD subdomain protein [Catellatospora sp. IY07-71]|uniref:HD domain-containing protein n=1 Tax=Catellatospora sp. IY07-71 TaxID=2728827 RepID=UPI001BB4C353|nr:HD domain-containing protein [Catellatospora sp. IY07-71]BCJ74495.1 metal-dependent phosphohydrolase, HD subdomain protein [Catellatospora sp. IY07-71]